MEDDTSKTFNKYKGQDRGGKSDYDHYFAGMDKTMRQKLAFICAHFMFQPGAVVADMGCGSGLGSYQLALLNPHIEVVAIDINPEAVRIAREKYKLPNLRFEVGDIENPDPALGPFDAVLNSSVLHHVYTFNGYNKDNVVNAVRNQLACMTQGAQMVIRDFMAWPDDVYYTIDLSSKGTGDTIETMSDADLLLRFAQTAKPLTPGKGQGFFLEELAPPAPDQRRFRLSAKWIAEFMLRKDYRANWEVELLEDYCFWSKQDYQRELRKLGARVVYTAPFWNSWIVENRFRNKANILDENGQSVDFPPTNFVAVIEKVGPEESLMVSERAISQKPKSYLLRQSYTKQGSSRIYDMIARPGDVEDFLPYKKGDDGTLFIYAKHGYPRPLVNTVPRGSPSLDQKSWSGHMIEPVSISSGGTSDEKRAALAERLGMDASLLDQMTKGLSYYPSPGMCDEFVTSQFIEVNEPDNYYTAKIDPAVSGFSTAGEARCYRAQDIIRTAQVGMLSEARLELNTYMLMRKMGETPDVWIGSEMLKSAEQHDVPVKKIEDIVHAPARQVYTPTEKSGDYLRHIRSGFADASAERENGRQEFEFVIPEQPGISTNVVSALPVVQGKDGEWYVGLEVRDLPAPQNKEGNSCIPVTPAWRLPTSVWTVEEAATFVTDKFDVTRDKVRQLGEGYFSSIGVTPERVFPFIVQVDPAKLKEPLHFVPLRDLFTKPHLLRDTHLMIAGMRGVHAMGLWADYAQAPAPVVSAAPTLRPK